MSSPQRGGAAAVPIAAPEPERPSWCDAEASAQHAIEHIIHQGSRLVYEHYLQEREDSLLASELLTDIYGVLAIAFGEPDREIIPEENYACLNLPEPAKIDTWSTHVIPVKRRTRMESSTSKKNVTTDNLTPRSTSQSSIKRPSPNAKKRLEEPLDNGEALHIITQIVEVPTTPKNPKFAGSPSKVEQYDESSEREESWFEAQLREEEEAMKANRELMAHLKRRDQEERERFEQLNREMKGKDYQVDLDGSIIVVDTKLLDHLPPQTVELDVKVAEPSTSPTAGRDVAAEKAIKRRPPAASTAKGHQEDNPELLKEFYKAPPTYQPPLDSTIRLVPGVEVRCGEVTRKGPDPMEDQRHMSKKEFQLHQKLLETNALSTSIIVQEDPKHILTGQQSLGGEITQPGSMREESRSVTTTTFRAVAGSGSPRPKSPSIASKRPPSSGKMVESIRGGKDGHLHQPAADDVNYELIGSPDWGRQHSAGKSWSPPRVPTRKARDQSMTEAARQASDASGLERLSPESGKRKQPRDRPFVHLAEPTRLPPPPLGSTTGHGMYRQSEAEGAEASMDIPRAATSQAERDNQLSEEQRFLPAINNASIKPDGKRPTKGASTAKKKTILTAKQLKEGGTVSIVKSDLTSKLLR